MPFHTVGGVWSAHGPGFETVAADEEGLSGFIIWNVLDHELLMQSE